MITPAGAGGPGAAHGQLQRRPDRRIPKVTCSRTRGRRATAAPPRAPNPIVDVPDAGHYTVSLTVTDQLGATGTSTVTVQATVDQLPPTASFTADADVGTSAVDGRARWSGVVRPRRRSADVRVVEQRRSDGHRRADVAHLHPGRHLTVTLTVTDNGWDHRNDVADDHRRSRRCPGLVAAFGFDEVSGTSVVDASGLGNNGTVSGATRSAAGRYGGALSFDGVNDSVSVPDAASLDLTNNMTLSAWVRPTGATGWRTVLMKERPGRVGLRLVCVEWGAGPVGRVGDRVGRAAGAVTVGVAGQHLVASGLHLQRGVHAAVRQRGRGRQPDPDRQRGGVAPGR